HIESCDASNTKRHSRHLRGLESAGFNLHIVNTGRQRRKTVYPRSAALGHPSDTRCCLDRSHFSVVDRGAGGIGHRAVERTAADLLRKHSSTQKQTRHTDPYKFLKHRHSVAKSRNEME